MPSAIDRTVPTSDRSASPSSSPSMRLLRMLVISSGFICMSRKVAFLGGASHLPPESFESVADARVEHHVAYADHEAPDEIRVHFRGELHPLSGLLLDLLADALHSLLVEFHGARHAHLQEVLLLRPEPVELAADAEQDGQPVLLGQQLEKADEVLVAPLDDLSDAVLLLLRREVGGEEEQLELAAAGKGIRDLAELLVDLIELIVLLGHLEEGARVDLGDLFHGLLRAPSVARAGALWREL